MCKINPFLNHPAFSNGHLKPGLGGNPFQFLATQALQQAWQGFLKNAESPQTGTSAQALTPQDAEPPAQDPAREAAQARIREIMGDYDPEDGDSDEKAQQIAGDPELCKYLTKEQRAELVKGLFDGDTGEDEEDAAMQILRSANPDDLKWVVGNVGWDELDSELDEGDLTEINTLMARPSPAQTDQVLDQVGISDADLDPKDGLEWSEFENQVQAMLNSMSAEERQKLIDSLQANKKEL